MNNIIPLLRTTNGNYEIVILEPSSFDATTQAVQALQENKVVILKLDILEQKEAQRILDFVSGCTYAISGHPLQIDATVFLFTPHSIQIHSGNNA